MEEKNWDESVEKSETDERNSHERQLSEVFRSMSHLLSERKYREFRTAVEELNSVDIAEFFYTLEDEKIVSVFKLLPKALLAEVFAELDVEMQEKIIAVLTDKEVSFILEDLYLDDAADIMEELPANVVKRVMKLATPETRSALNRLLSYPENSAGSIMTGEFLSLKESMTCEEAIARIRTVGADKETVYNAYVTNSQKVLIGSVEFKDLLFSDSKRKVGDLMEEQIPYVHTLDDQEQAAEMISKYDLLALPVVDKEMRLVGIVTVDDALDVLQEEVTEDMEKMAAILPSDKPYLKTGVWTIFKKRIPWLLLLMVTAVFTGAIISRYESAIGTYAVLTAFIPMLMDTGGNAGSQTAVTVIRGLSIGEVGLKDVFRILWKELRVSFLCGLVLGIVCFIKTIAVDFHFILHTTLDSGLSQNNMMVAVAVSVTVMFAVVLAKMVGALLPLAAKRVGLDPAVMASPFITTIVDVLTLMAYFFIASKMIGF